MDAQPSNNPTVENWQVDAGGEIYQGSFEELTQWIAEGSLLPQDMVKRGNLRWIEAQKVPSLHKFFNAKELGAVPPVVTTTPFPKVPQTVSAPILNNLDQIKLCLVHTETESKFVCEACANFFCGECPTSFGGTVKVCPMCGAMCQSLEKAVEETKKSIIYHQAVTEGFGFSDFAKSFTYPFKYPASFIFGAIFYVFFTVGQQASAIGGIWLLAGAIICWMLANMLTFGILSNTVENMLQGKLDQSFMPSFDNFSLWDDVIHPLFLSISVYLASFGALILVVLVMIYFVAGSLKPNDSQSLKAVQTVAPETAGDFGAAQHSNEQINFFKEAARQRSEQMKQRLAAVEGAETDQPAPTANDEEKEFQKMNEMINKTRQAQLESALGKPQEETQIGFKSLAQQILKGAIPFILLAGIALIWGIFYLPVAYIVAAYTRNISSVFNPSIGLDTIKRLGFDYIKILIMGFVLLLISGFIGMTLTTLLAPFNLPKLGNIPAIAIGSIFGFYLSIVFSTILGLALYKNSNKFPLFQTL